MNVTTLSVVIPVYNEVKTVQNVIDAVEEADIGNINKEIIIVDDLSTDGTRDILKKLNPEKYKIILKEKNEGKGATVKVGILASTGDLLIIQDADLEYDPHEFSIMLEPFLKNKADVVYGSRFRGGRPSRMIYYQNQLANKVITALSNLFTKYNLSDVETGYKMFKGELIRTIAPKPESKKFGFELEVTAYLSRTNARLYEVGIAYYGRSKEEGKHIGISDGFLAIWEIFKYNLFR